MDEVNIEDMHEALERRVRHSSAILASDIQALRNNLASAASRFEDIADLMEKDPSYKPEIEFLRASARRYRRAALR